MIQFIINKKTNQIMPKTLWAVSELMNDDVIWLEDVVKEIPEEFSDDPDALEVFCINKWYDFKSIEMFKQVKFDKAEKQIIE